MPPLKIDKTKRKRRQALPRMPNGGHKLRGMRVSLSTIDRKLADHIDLLFALNKMTPMFRLQKAREQIRIALEGEER